MKFCHALESLIRKYRAQGREVIVLGMLTMGRTFARRFRILFSLVFFFCLVRFFYVLVCFV
jgi:hypothetical protein